MTAILHKLSINAPVEKVYEAITTQKGLSGWWAKQTTAKPELNFINTFTFGNSLTEMKIIQLVPNKKVEWLCINANEEWMNTHISFDLEEKNEKTIVRFSHTDWQAATDFFADCNFNWAKFLYSLRLLCETGSGNPV
ncbi:SRPBCC family protein [Pedobacter sp.]|uniref:SRPBCC family protein n=1 Tax=Pedobacter sp. TaxID=1411316 RepID=UPI00396C43A1